MFRLIAPRLLLSIGVPLIVLDAPSLLLEPPPTMVVPATVPAPIPPVSTSCQPRPSAETNPYHGDLGTLLMNRLPQVNMDWSQSGQVSLVLCY